MTKKNINKLLEDYVNITNEIKELQCQQQSIKDALVTTVGENYRTSKYVMYVTDGIYLDQTYLKENYPDVYEDCKKQHRHFVSITTNKNKQKCDYVAKIKNSIGGK